MSQQSYQIVLIHFLLMLLFISNGKDCKEKKNNAFKVVRIWSFCGLYFPAFGLNTGKYRPEKLRIRTIFYAVTSTKWFKIELTFSSLHSLYYLKKKLLVYTKPYVDKICECANKRCLNKPCFVNLGTNQMREIGSLLERNKNQTSLGKIVNW